MESYRVFHFLYNCTYIFITKVILLKHDLSNNNQRNKENRIPLQYYQKIDHLDFQLKNMQMDYWQHHVFLSFQWWILLFALVFPWIFWFIFVDKQRIKDILLFGTILSLLIALMDELGVSLDFWSYPYKLIQILPNLVAVDFGLIIVVHMLIYQHFTSWKGFITVNVVVALLYSFIGEPITVKLDIYQLDHWKYIYSFPIYVIKAMFVKWLVDYAL